jgi:hypothetical protein
VGEVIWVEVLSPHRDVLSRQRCELAGGGEVLLGRGYDNDVIVDDPFVAPRHVRVFRDESGRLVAEDVGTVNGMFLDHETTRRDRIPIDGDAPLRIGRTWLRIRDASAAVAPEREEPRAARTWHAVFLFTAALLALTLVETWIDDTGESKASTYVFPQFLVGAFVLAWTATWSVLSRIFAGMARVERHAYIATLGLFVTSLLTWLAGLFAYSFSLPSLAIVDSFGFWVWVSVLSFFHLREIGPRHLVLKGAIVGSLALLGIGGQMVSRAESGGPLREKVAVDALKPPWLRFASPQSEEEFFADVEALQPKLDLARTEESPSGGGLLDELGLDE